MKGIKSRPLEIGGGKVRHTLRISVSKEPAAEGIVSCRNVSVRERFLRFLFGEKQRLTIIVLGGSVRELAVSEVMEEETYMGKVKLLLDVIDKAGAGEKTLTLKEVRAVLAEKSRSEHTEEVREQLAKHGADKLSEIDPAEYVVLLAEAEVL